MVAQFRCVDAAVIRVAASSGELDLPPWPDLTGSSPEHAREWRSWLARVWEQEALVEAIEVASPVLARRVVDVCGGQAQHRAVARPDAAWLAEVIAQLEARPDVRRRLPVMANNLSFVRGDRLVVPSQQPPELLARSGRVRHTKAVQTTTQDARSPKEQQ
ncbi:MAG: lantibiotic dehydratase [Pseudonocardiaceae bacterium]